MTFFAQTLLACLLTAVLVIALRRPAVRLGLLDYPGGRKRHADAVPLTGGISLAIGFCAALAVSFSPLGEFTVFLVLTGLLASVGLLDDFVEATPRAKFAVQLLAALLMATWGGHRLLSLGDLFAFGSVELAALSIPFTVFATVAVVNGINMLDGLDGLAGGLVALMLGYFALFAFWLGETDTFRVILLLFGAVIGFLLFNVPHPWLGRRRTFMGDAGSLVLGFAVAWFTVDLTQRAVNAVPPVVMLWVVGLVLFDLFTVTVRRVLRGRNPVTADRGHIHHLLQRLQISNAGVLSLLLLVNAALGAIGTVAWRVGVPQHVLFGAFVVLGFAYAAAFMYPGWMFRWHRRRQRRT